MSMGTPRITIRLLDDVRSAIAIAVAERNNARASERPWKMTDWIYAAILEKLAKTRRGRKLQGNLTVEKPDDNLPREVESTFEDGELI